MSQESNSLNNRKEVINFVKSLSDKEIEKMLLLKEMYDFAQVLVKQAKDETSAASA